MSSKEIIKNVFGNKGDKKMKEVVEFLQANPVQYLATVGRDGKAKCRPFMFCFEQEGRLWFCTNNTKDVYKDLQVNPELEVSVSSPEYAWIRLNGKAVFENNMAVKEACMTNPIIKGQYNEASNPIFEVFYLENAKAVIADFSGNPPKEYNL
ncbi:putative pyridoxamine 5'-phosphate oxidase family protein [Clostridium beijerinckii]|uniref:Pyridoxamine 5'-phosphate oxidase family protein n=2 Tax=Clostridiaceae TaxID=31979 RepID=A0AAE5LQR7_CLOBE|nr:putative pyridoxamine 5'-phosphate oxidase family protein [Clostridium beijerinckii]OOM25143.1 pyridoxamine 5'-phosphate oxidase [Clostridium beijerinckii]